MLPIYENQSANLEIIYKKPEHESPHLHKSLEMVYVTSGSLEIGIGQNLFHMEKGDFAAVFPGLVHHYQVFNPSDNRAVYILVDPSLSGIYIDTLQSLSPENPVIKRKLLHPDVEFCIGNLIQNTYDSLVTDETISLSNDTVPSINMMNQAFVQIIMTRCFPLYKMVDRSIFDSDDLVFRSISYISAHYTEDISLTSMAKDLYVSPYTLSRLFSNTFHRNFNSYINEIRLEQATKILEYTDQTITEACMNSGFESQRTFNRVFKEKYHMSPREFRDSFKIS